MDLSIGIRTIEQAISLGQMDIRTKRIEVNSVKTQYELALAELEAMLEKMQSLNDTLCVLRKANKSED